MKQIFLLSILILPFLTFTVQAQQSGYPEDDLDNVFQGQDTLFQSEQTQRTVYLSILAGPTGLVEEQVGLLGYAFNTGLRFKAEWSSGIFAFVMPDLVSTTLGTVQPVFIGAEGSYHADTILENFSVGLKLGAMTVENDASLAAALKFNYDFPLSDDFSLTSELMGVLNLNSANGGSVIAGLVGLKFKRDMLK